MSYQRWGKPGRFYVWASDDALHIWQDEVTKVAITANVEGRDNAKAIFHGLVDFLGPKVAKELLKRGRH